MINLFKIFKTKNDDIVKAPEEAPKINTAPAGAGVMTIEDVFSITGRGTVATGRVESGSFHLNDAVRIVKTDGDSIQTVITGIEQFRKTLDYAQAGDNVGILLKDVSRDQINRGDRIES